MQQPAFSPNNKTDSPVAPPNNIPMDPANSTILEKTINPTHLEVHSSHAEKIYEPPNISLMVLGGFITAIGIAAVAIAFAVLSIGIPFLITAGIGVVATLVGIGVFSAGVSKKEQTIPSQNGDPFPSPH